MLVDALHFRENGLAITFTWQKNLNISIIKNKIPAEIIYQHGILSKKYIKKKLKQYITNNKYKNVSLVWHFGIQSPTMNTSMGSTLHNISMIIMIL